jgi:hypothetical protein
MRASKTDKGAAVVIGFLSILALAVIGLSIYQLQVVPQEKETKAIEMNNEDLTTAKQFAGIIENTRLDEATGTLYLKGNKKIDSNFLDNKNNLRNEITFKTTEMHEIKMNRLCVNSDDTDSGRGAPAQTGGPRKGSPDRNIYVSSLSNGSTHYFKYMINSSDSINGEYLNNIEVNYPEDTFSVGDTASDKSNINTIGFDINKDGFFEQRVSRKVTSINSEDGLHTLNINFDDTEDMGSNTSLYIKYDNVNLEKPPDETFPGDSGRQYEIDVSINGEQKGYKIEIDDCAERKLSFNTSNYLFEPDYSNYRNPMIFGYESGLVYSAPALANESSDSVLYRTGDIIDGKSINLTVTEDDFKLTKTKESSIQIPKVDGSRFVLLDSTDYDKTTISLPTEISEESWKRILQDELVSNGGYVKNFDYKKNISGGGCEDVAKIRCTIDTTSSYVNIHLKNETTYKIRVKKLNSLY